MILHTSCACLILSQCHLQTVHSRYHTICLIAVTFPCLAFFFIFLNFSPPDWVVQCHAFSVLRLPPVSRAWTRENNWTGCETWNRVCKFSLKGRRINLSDIFLTIFWNTLFFFFYRYRLSRLSTEECDIDQVNDVLFEHKLDGSMCFVDDEAHMRSQFWLSGPVESNSARFDVEKRENAVHLNMASVRWGAVASCVPRPAVLAGYSDIRTIVSLAVICWRCSAARARGAS